MLSVVPVALSRRWMLLRESVYIMVFGIGMFLCLAYWWTMYIAASIAVPSVRNDDGVIPGTGAAPRANNTFWGVDICHAHVVVDPSVPITNPAGSKKAAVRSCSGEVSSMWAYIVRSHRSLDGK